MICLTEADKHRRLSRNIFEETVKRNYTCMDILGCVMNDFIFSDVALFFFFFYTTRFYIWVELNFDKQIFKTYSFIKIVLPYKNPIFCMIRERGREREAKISPILILIANCIVNRNCINPSGKAFFSFSCDFRSV